MAAVTTPRWRRVFDTAVRRTRVRAWLIAAAIMTTFSSVTLVLWLGARAVLDGTMTGGDLAKFLSYAIFMGTAVAALAEMWGELQRASGAMERTVELLGSRPSIVDAGKSRGPESGAKGADLLRTPVIQLSVAARHPRTRATSTWRSRRAKPWPSSGPSGAGKSTVFQLLLRFYDPASGRILIDGVDIAHADPQRCAARIGLVPQETMIFGASARENIRYGRPEASDAEIEAAARAAAADEFIRQAARGLRHLPRRTRRAAVGRPEAAHRHRARHPQEPAHPAARRGHQLAGFGKRAPGAGRAREAHAQPHHAGHRAPAGHRHQFRSHRGRRPRPHRRHRPARSNCCATTRCTRDSRSYNSASVPTPPRLENHMAYVDGFLVPVPKKNAEKYKKIVHRRPARCGWTTARSATTSAWPTT